MQDIKNAMPILHNMNLCYNFLCENSPLIQNVASFPMKCKSTKLGSVGPYGKWLMSQSCHISFRMLSSVIISMIPLNPTLSP